MAYYIYLIIKYYHECVNPPVPYIRIATVSSWLPSSIHSWHGSCIRLVDNMNTYMYNVAAWCCVPYWLASNSVTSLSIISIQQAHAHVAIRLECPLRPVDDKSICIVKVLIWKVGRRWSGYHIIHDGNLNAIQCCFTEEYWQSDDCFTEEHDPIAT